jgi:hypothetical protein
MAVGIDSIGYKEYFKELYDDVGIKMSTAATMYYQQHDKKILLGQVHALKNKIKKKER